eukprot:g17227.t1
MPDYAINAPKESFIEVIGQYQIAEAMMENWLEKKKIVPYWLKNETSSTAESSSSEEGEGRGGGGVGEGSAGGAERGEDDPGERDSGSEEGKKQAQQKSSVEARLSSALQDSGMEEKGFVMKSCLVALEDDLLMMFTGGGSTASLTRGLLRASPTLLESKSKRLAVTLVSAAQTGYLYATTKSPLKAEFRMALRKYDPVVNQHVMFYETKLPVWRRQAKRAIERRYARHTGERNKELIQKISRSKKNQVPVVWDRSQVPKTGSFS